jgi:hypothetical protein
MEAGEIEFRAEDAGEGDLVFTIESWTRSGDRLAAAVYDRLRFGKEMQLHMWTHFCTRVVDLCGGEMTGVVEVDTEREEIAEESRRKWYVTRAVAVVFTKSFALLARLRGGRPLHPHGLVFDGTLALHGTSRFWGVPLLDDREELGVKVRLSRAVGLPPALPDVLGLALRWRQTGRTAPGAGECDGASENGGPDTAELLLATTGHTLIGRHLLRPATRWSPAFYGSLLPYEAGDRHVLLGAVAQRPHVIPAGPAALARAVDERPMVLDLVVATELGSWERFGELRLMGPARSDDSEPMRFNPARHPIPGLRPIGLFHRVRDPVYSAVQNIARTGIPMS